MDLVSIQARAHVRLKEGYEEEERAMLAWGENPTPLTAEDTYVWRGILNNRAMESLEAGDEESLKRNQVLQLAWDEAGTMWAEQGFARQERFSSPEEANFHDLVQKLTGPTERSKQRVKKIREREKRHASDESFAQSRLDRATREADEEAVKAARAEQIANTTDDESLRRAAVSESKDAREAEKKARDRAEAATKQRDRSRRSRQKARGETEKALAKDGKHALKAKEQLEAAGYSTDEEGLQDLAADPIETARAKVIIGTAREIDWADKLISTRRNSMLGGAATQFVNTLSVPLFVALQQPSVVAGAVAHDVTGGRSGGVGLRALSKMYAGYVANLGKAATNALTSFKTSTQFFETEVMKKEDGQSRVEAPNQAFSGATGWLVEWPQRMLGAVDDFHKTWLTMGHLEAYAYQQARDKEGMSHEEAVEYASDVLLDPSNELWDKALAEARRLTFTTKTENFVMEFVQKGRQHQNPYVRLASHTPMPFTQTPVNVFTEGVRQTPLGLAWLPFEYAKAAQDGDYSQATARTMQMAVGSMIGYALLEWVLGDDDEYPWITGSDLQWTPEQRELFGRRGMPQANSIRIGDTWWSYERWDPYATTISLTVDALNAWKRGEFSEIPAATINSLTRASVDKTFFSGISDIAEAIRRSQDVRPGEEGSEAFWRGAHHFGISYTTSWVPAYIKNTFRAQQDVYPERGLWGKFPEFGERAVQRIVQRAEMGLAEDRPRIALFGEPIPRHTPFSNPALDFAWKFASPIKTKAHDPFVGNRIIMNWNWQNPKAQLNPRSPRYVRVEDTTIYLSNEQLEEFARRGGGYAREIINARHESGGFDDPAKPSRNDMLAVKDAVIRGYNQAKMDLLPKWNQNKQIEDKIYKRKVETREMTQEQVDELKAKRYVAP